MSVEGRHGHAIAVARGNWRRFGKAGYRAALVGSEARERELGRERDEAKKWQDHYELAASDRAGEIVGLLDALTDMQAREAVLVEALKGRDAIDKIAAIVAESRGCKCGGARDCGCWNVALRIQNTLAALAGVVEAEPDGSER